MQVETINNLQFNSGRWPTWSESLFLGLEQVNTPLVLLILDDFFLSGNVDVVALQTAVDKMVANNYSHITLTEYGRSRPSIESRDPFLLSIQQDARYRVSTSPALWRKSSLMTYLRSHENAWQFEVFGSIRAKKKIDTFYAVNPKETINGKAGVLPYFYGTWNTGIVKGKWQREIQPFFASNGIIVDYSERGFFAPLPSVLNKLNTIKKLFQSPLLTIRGLLGM